MSSTEWATKLKRLGAGMSITLGVLAQPVMAVEINECFVKDLASKVECGELAVPLNYNAPEGDQLDIGFVRLPAFNGAGRKTPLFFLAGGPGQSATSLAARINDMFSDVRSDRDIVLVDQRGTGRSAALECDQEELDTLAPTSDIIDAEILAKCVEQLPVGIEHFTTANAVRDFEAVREALGLAKVSLYGGSYGSRAAIAYLALAGEHVEAVILDGISPPSVPIGLFGTSAAASFDLALSRCQQTPECAVRFPGLRDQFERVNGRLKAAPVEVTIPHPTTGKPELLRLWHGQFLNLVRLTLYDPGATALLPLLISEADAGNYQPLAALAVGASGMADINIMLNLNIVCNEDAPRFTDATKASDADNNFDREMSHRLWQEACALMPRFSPELGWMSVHGFLNPALLLSGQADPVTPPSNGERAATLFQSARHVIAPHAAHIVASSECGGKMIASFLNNSDPSAIDSSCLDNAPAPRFVLDTMGSMSRSATKSTKNTKTTASEAATQSKKESP